MYYRVEALGGRLDVASTPGHGTRVTGFIPRLRRPQAKAPPAPDEKELEDAIPA
jgi:signal transduction histidine kinase